jgi:DNA-binding Lrp family transcriptional regulator
MGSSRLPRFTRSEKIASVRLTERDGQILQCIYRHRFLRSNQIVALVGGSQQQTIRRLQRLFHHGYLERPSCQIDYYKSGSRRIAHGLGNRGANWLKRELSLPFHTFDWGAKNRVGKIFLEHALMVSDFMVGLELACRRRSDVRLLSEEDLNLPKSRRPFQWRVEVNRRLSCTVIPDHVFGLENDGKRCWYFLEADRATMPVTRRRLDRSSFHRKLLAYEATWAQQVHWRDFGIHRFRVLTMTTNPVRVQSMIEACQKLKQGRGLFLFTDTNSFQNQIDFLQLQWQTSSGHRSASILIDL